MVRIENIESKISSLHTYLDKLSRYQSIKIEEIKADQDLTGATERYLFLATQAAIDLAEMTTKLKKLGKCESMSQAFILLKEADIIDEELCERMIRMVGFRNALSHGYEDLDYSIVNKVLQNGLLDIEALVASIKDSV